MVNLMIIETDNVIIGQSGTDMNKLFKACLRQIKEENSLWFYFFFWMNNYDLDWLAYRRKCMKMWDSTES